MSDDKGKQQTKVEEIREVIKDIHALSVDIRDKAYTLTSSSVVDQEAAKEPEAPTENVGNELNSNLRNIRGILREAYDTFSAFV